MVKYTQIICRQFANELFECVWPFCDIGALRVKESKLKQFLNCKFDWPISSQSPFMPFMILKES